MYLGVLAEGFACSSLVLGSLRHFELHAGLNIGFCSGWTNGGRMMGQVVWIGVFGWLARGERVNMSVCANI